MTKICKGCGRELPTSMFYSAKGRADGLQPYCKDCCKRHGRLKQGNSGKYKNSITGFTDIQLVKELRNRGYDVTCTKKVTTTIVNEIIL